MKKLNVEIDEELHRRLKILAAKRRKPIKLLTPELLARAIKEEEKEVEKEGE